MAFGVAVALWVRSGIIFDIIGAVLTVASVTLMTQLIRLV